MSVRTMVAPVVLGIASLACAVRVVDPRLHEVGETLPVTRGPLKVHMTSGDLYVLRTWQLVGPPRAIQGHGEHFGITREGGRAGQHLIPLEGVALLETSQDKRRFPGGLQGLAFMTTVFGGLAIG